MTESNEELIEFLRSKISKLHEEIQWYQALIDVVKSAEKIKK